jgi:hypothetical protein
MLPHAHYMCIHPLCNCIRPILISLPQPPTLALVGARPPRLRFCAVAPSRAPSRTAASPACPSPSPRPTPSSTRLTPRPPRSTPSSTRLTPMTTLLHARSACTRVERFSASHARAATTRSHGRQRRSPSYEGRLAASRRSSPNSLDPIRSDIAELRAPGAQVATRMESLEAKVSTHIK